MMSVDDLLEIANTRSPTQGEIAACCSNLDSDVDRALDSIALTLALRYEAGMMSFTAADETANSLHSWCLLTWNRLLPELALRVFLAFDEGEYDHPGDPSEVDPAEKYTRPMIRAVLHGQNATSSTDRNFGSSERNSRNSNE